MLAERYGGPDLINLLVPQSAYHPFPTADERKAWESLPAELRQAAVSKAEDYLDYAWPSLPATLYLDFARTGNRVRYERPFFARRSALASLVIAECVDAKGRFLDDIANGIWALCEESSWVLPSCNWDGSSLADLARPAIDLFAGETGGLLAWTHYLLQARLDAVEPLIAERIRREVSLRLLDPFLDRNDFFWMGIVRKDRLNNWSPWCSSNVLACSLLLEPDAKRRTQTVRKAMEILDRFLAGYRSDGGCEEGPSYWGVAGASLFDCLELLRAASGGTIDVYSEALIQEIGRYIYRVQMSGDHFANFADAQASVHLPAALVYRYGQRIDDPRVMALGSSAYHRASGPRALLAGSLLRVLPNLFDTKGIDSPATPPYPGDVWLSDLQVMVAREQEGSDRGFCLAAKGGSNGENSHNHNDVGHFIVYCDGTPILVDPGVETYTRQTFDAKRYELWTMQSAYHNLPTVNGVLQQPGEGFRATDVCYRRDDEGAEFSLDIAEAYPPTSGIRSWRRNLRLRRGPAPAVEVTDEFALSAPTADIALSLMTPCEPSVDGPGTISLESEAGPVMLSYDHGLTPTVETIVANDEWLSRSWGVPLRRILLKPTTATAQARWEITLRRGKC